LERKVTRDQVVAVAMLKWFKQAVDSYDGPLDFANFRAYMVRVVDAKNFKADEILADAGAEIL
jgi:hypothetical protein